MISETFAQRLAVGQLGESAVANYYKRQGWDVLPVYETSLDEFKGPRLFTASRNLIAPDLLVMRPDRFAWIEVKQKTSFTWHRITQRWTTGINKRHYEDYLVISERYPNLYLLFLHTTSYDKTHPQTPCPTGLFGGRIDRLKTCVNHQSDKWDKGMVYWAVQSLTPIATLDDVFNSHRQTA